MQLPLTTSLPTSRSNSAESGAIDGWPPKHLQVDSTHAMMWVMPTLQPKHQVPRNCPSCGGKHMGGERGPVTCTAQPTQATTRIGGSGPDFGPRDTTFRSSGTFSLNGFRDKAVDHS